MYDAVIIGAGFGGLGQAATLKHHGIDNFVILERADDVGGVWRDNTYPGVACDTQSVIYCFSYDLHLEASSMYAPGHELHAYLKNFTRKFGILPHLRTHADVTHARWDSATRTWTVSLRNGESLQTRAVISACGQLGSPYTPNFPGLDTFEGEQFHASRWRHDIDLAGKRVASIGAAATAIQYVPEIAPEVAHLDVFQRSANYILPREEQLFDTQTREAMHTDPEVFRDVREFIYNDRETGFYRTLEGTAASEEGKRQALGFLEREITDPELLEKLTPDFPYGCKRTLRSDAFYPTLRRDNVDLVTEEIREVTPQGIITADGELHELDVIIFATGFQRQKFIDDIDIIGTDGVDLAQRWGISPEAYYGITVDGYPNLFLVYGPNTNLNHNSVVSMLEIQHDYIADFMTRISSGSVHAVEVDADALARVNEKIQKELEASSYSADCSSWFKNSEGRVTNNWSSTVEDYRVALKTPHFQDYTVV